MTILQHAIAQAAATSSSYQISRSLRFNSADSAYLNRTPASAGNRKTWTWSGWVKRNKLGSDQVILSGQVGSTTSRDAIRFRSGDTLDFDINDLTVALIQTTQVFRDVSAFFHLQVALDTTQATASNRVKIWINGSQITTFATATYPAQNTDGNINAATAQGMGVHISASPKQQYADFELADVYFIDGQALTPSSFGETDSATGVWVPKAYTGTFGTNGFWLKLDDNSGVTATTLGKDSSGNSNNWTPNNFSVTAGVGNDSLVDSPTNYGTDTGAGGEVRGNYCTLNPLSYNGTSPVLSNGNLDFKASSAAYSSCVATMGIPSSGKWYWEVAVTTITTAGNNQDIAIGKYPFVSTDNMTLVCKLGVTFSTLAYYYATPSVSPTNNNAGLSAPAQGDIMRVAYDADTGKVWMGVNGTWISSGNPATGANPLYTYSDPANVFPFQVMYNTTGLSSTNFGQRPFAYTAPSGFKALCTQNLPTPAIGASAGTLASKNFDTTLYTGNGSTQTITNASGFQPDLVWVKNRAGTQWHNVSDVLRGVNSQLYTNDTGAQGTATNALTAFNSNGFSVGAAGDWNGNTYSMVAWQWKAGGAGVSNTAGSITSTVSANQTAGISIATYTGNGSSSQTIGHGLGVAPKMVIIKGRSNAFGWGVQHVGLTGGNNYLALNQTAAQGTDTSQGSITSATSTTLQVSGSGGASSWSNANGVTYVAYAFAEVAGFSKFGSYTGNGSTDGPFVYCGFRPRFIMIKRSDSTSGWVMIDTARDTYNYADKELFANLSNAEASAGASYSQDILSNGFKIRRASDSSFNASGGTYIFAAFAEAPFNYARAR